MSAVTYLHACQMVSYNRMTETLGGMFNLKLSEGAIANMLARAQTQFAAQATGTTSLLLGPILPPAITHD